MPLRGPVRRAAHPVSRLAEQRRRRAPLDRLQRALVLRTLPHPRRFRAAAWAGRPGSPARAGAAPLARRDARAAARPRAAGAAAAGPGRRPGPAPGARRAARRLRAAGAGARHQLGDAARARAQRRRGRHPARAGLLRRPGAAHRRGRAGQAARASQHEGLSGRRGRRAHHRGGLRLGHEGVRVALPGRARPRRARRSSPAASWTSARSSRSSGWPIRSPRRPGRWPSPTTTPATSRTPRGSATPRGSCCEAIDGVTLVEPAEWELCCGSAGTYNIEQPEIAARARTAQGPEPARHGRGAASPPATSAA